MQGLIGQEVGGYRIVSQIGKGGMATVFKAYQPSLDRYVAVKVMPPYYAEQDDTFIKRFRREAKAIASLRHPNILIVIDYGEENDTTFIVMEFVEAGTLSELLGKPMAPEPMRGLIDQLAGALQYAHEQGVVHRDIKPSNILLPKPDWPLLTDFGLAKMVGGSQLTLTGTIAGTPAYMSPEQGRGEKVDSRSDIYSLGIVLYEMATGVVPFHAETPMAVVVKHIIDPLPLPRSKNPELPEEIERVILKALSKERADRFQQAGELARALNEAVKGLPEGVAEAVPSVPVGQTTTIEAADEVDLAAAQQVAEGLEDSGVEPAAVRATGGLLSGRRRIAAAVAGGLLIVAVVAIGAAQLFGGATEELGDSRTQDQLVADARAALEGDDPSAGLEDLDRAIEGDPENVDLYFERARALAQNEDPDGAMDSIGAALEIASEESWAHEEAGYLLMDLQEYGPAAEEFRQALRLDPSTTWNYSNLAAALVADGRDDEATAALMSAFDNPAITDDPRALNDLGWDFLLNDRLDEAEQAFFRSIEGGATFPDPWEGLANQRYAQGDIPAAITELQAAIDIFPEHDPFYESIGFWAWEIGEYDRAIEAFGQALEIDPLNSYAAANLAGLLTDLGREQEGEDLLQGGVERYPNDAGYHSELAGFYASQGRYDEAIPLYERATELQPNEGWLPAYLGQLLIDTGDVQAGLERLAEASARNAGDPWLSDFIGTAYATAGECDAAIAHYEQALAIDPSIESARQGIADCGG